MCTQDGPPLSMVKKIIQICNQNSKWLKLKIASEAEFVYKKGMRIKLLILISIDKKQLEQVSYMNYGYIISYSIFMQVNFRAFIIFVQ